MATTRSTHEDWDLRECGPTNAEHTVLLIAGGMCSGEFFEDVMAQPALSSLRVIAATIPGFAGSKAPEDRTMEG